MLRESKSPKTQEPASEASWRPVLIAELVFLTEDIRQQTRTGIRQDQFRDGIREDPEEDEGVIKTRFMFEH